MDVVYSQPWEQSVMVLFVPVLTGMPVDYIVLLQDSHLTELCQRNSVADSPGDYPEGEQI